MDSHRILFYSHRDEYGQFSNFFAAPISLRGKIWPTTEHFFQAMKFEGSAYADTIRTASSPGKAASLGRSRAHPLRPDWESAKYDLMKEAVRAKFTQHSDLRLMLLGGRRRWYRSKSTGESANGGADRAEKLTL